MEFGETDPQGAVEQETAQATPLPGSLTTVALNWTVWLSCTVAELLEREMLMLGGGVELPPQPKLAAATTAAANTLTTREHFLGDIAASIRTLNCFFGMPLDGSIHAPEWPKI